MRKIIILLAIAISLSANINIKQNIRALYKGIDLTTEQKNYILDSKDRNINIILEELLKHKSEMEDIREKNVVSFIIDKEGNVSKFKFLKKSDNRTIDKLTENIIKKVANKFVAPVEKTELRYIIDYDFIKKVTYKNEYKTNNSTKSKYDSIKYIENGTHTFKYSSKEYIRRFSVSEDGFINLKHNICARTEVLTSKNQKVSLGYQPFNKNAPIRKGDYKLLVSTNKDCDISIQYP